MFGDLFIRQLYNIVIQLTNSEALIWGALGGPDDDLNSGGWRYVPNDKKNNITLGVFGGILLVYVSFCEYAYKYLPHNTKKYNFLKSEILDMKESSK